MQWSIPNFSQHPQDGWTFTENCVFNNKIFIIKNSTNAENVIKMSLEISDDMEIYVLDLNPSLEALCAAKILELNLDQSKLPKKLQHELKKYTNKPKTPFKTARTNH
ncbi:hypothetical protein CHUAL_014237 [Chamberlinius hualienensis]